MPVSLLLCVYVMGSVCVSVMVGTTTRGTTRTSPRCAAVTVCVCEREREREREREECVSSRNQPTTQTNHPPNKLKIKKKSNQRMNGWAGGPRAGLDGGGRLPHPRVSRRGLRAGACVCVMCVYVCVWGGGVPYTTEPVLLP
jgi:hypothetical protein